MPANPTQAEQGMLNFLKQINDQLKKMNQSAAQGSSNKLPQKRSIKSLVENLEKTEKGVIKFNKTIGKAEKDFEKSAKLFGSSLEDVVKNALIPGRKIVKTTFKEWKESFGNMVKDQNFDYRKLAENTRDYIRTNKKATANIKVATGAFKEYVGVVRNIARNKRTISAADEKAIQNFKAIATVGQQLKGVKLNLFNNLTQQQVAALDKFKKGAMLTNDQFRQLATITEQLNKNFGVITNVTETYSTELTKSIGSLRESLTTAFKNFFREMKLAFAAIIPQTLSDLEEQTKNAIKQSNYGQAIRGAMGVSEGQLAEFQGQNRLMLRLIGGGRAANPVENGQLSELHKRVREMPGFGLGGEAGLKLLGSTLDALGKSGTRLTSENVIPKVTEQMQILSKSMQQTGMSFDDLQSTINDLSQSPAFLDIIKSHGYNGPAEEIAVLNKIRISTGFSMDYLKDMLEMQRQSKYQGIGEIVKAQIGTRLETNLLNRYGAKISPQEERLMELRRQGASDQFFFNNPQLFSGLTTKTGQSVRSQKDMQQFLLELPTKFAMAQVKTVDKLSNRGGGVPLGMFNTLQSIFGDMMGGNVFNPNAAISAQANLQTMYGSQNPTADQINKIMGANDDLVTNIKDLSNAFIPFGEKLNSLVRKIQDMVKSFGQNPAGQAATALGHAAGSLLEGLGIGVGLGKLGKFMPGGGGNILTKLIRPLVTNPIVRAGVGGYAAGTIINKAPEWFGAKQETAAYIVDLIDHMTGAHKVTSAGEFSRLHGTIVRPGISNGAHPISPPKVNIKHPEPDNQTITPDSSLTPAGDTTGDLWKDNNSKLSQLVDMLKRLLDTIQTEHKEYMDYLAQQDKYTQQQAARVANVNGYPGSPVKVMP